MTTRTRSAALRETSSGPAPHIVLPPRERPAASPNRQEPAPKTPDLVALPRGRNAARIKRAIDVVGSLALLTICAVPMLVIAALVKLTSRGPAMFRQERVGRGGRRFMMLKFRTMRVDAESTTGPVWASRHDPRRTAFGSFLRRLSLDELPQFLNILRGDMSLVGPRPERPYFVESFSKQLPHYDQRHLATPGLTGWAQLNGLRGDTSIAMRLEYDLYYIRYWSLWLDLFILLLTPLRVLTDKHAY